VNVLDSCRRRLSDAINGVRHAVAARLWPSPASATPVAGTGADLLRSRAQLLAENAFLRQQLIVLRRGVDRPVVTRTDRALLVLLAGRVRAWRQALLVVQPETLLRWHRAGFRALWRWKSRSGPGRPPLSAQTVALIRQMATDNPLWGAERIRGELAKLGLHVAKRTIQAHLRGSRAPRPRGQTWTTFLHNHAEGIWACDFLPVTDLLFRPLFAFFIVELASRRVVHVGATRHPTDAWVAQQLREATPFDQRPTYLLRDNDSKFGATFARVAEASGVEMLRTPYRAPRANAVCERFLGSVCPVWLHRHPLRFTDIVSCARRRRPSKGAAAGDTMWPNSPGDDVTKQDSVRRECLDHLLIMGERQLARVLREYVAYFNRDRPLFWLLSSSAPVVLAYGALSAKKRRGRGK
jgi:putative transposase